MTEREMYLGAIKVLKRDGWCKGRYTNYQGLHCMMGAIWDTNGHAPYSTLIDVCGGHPIQFNDKHCESADDAIGALQIAADLAA